MLQGMSIDPVNPNLEPHPKGMVGSISNVLIGQLSGRTIQRTILMNPSTTMSTTQSEIVPTHTSKVHSIQTTT
jgi:hypothetical protein